MQRLDDGNHRGKVICHQARTAARQHHESAFPKRASARIGQFPAHHREDRKLPVVRILDGIPGF
jgi:hypothetical protein